MIIKIKTKIKYTKYKIQNTTGNLVKWVVELGGEEVAGDVLAEIETDKATMEFEASDDGYLAAILVPEGANGVPVGTPM